MHSSTTSKRGAARSAAVLGAVAVWAGLSACSASGRASTATDRAPSMTRSASTVATGSTGARTGTTGPAALTAGVQRRLRAILVSAPTGQRSIGVAAAVVTPTGTWVSAVGRSGDGQLLVPRSAMPIFSITKTFTAAEVMHLVERGKIRLDAKVSSYIALPFRDNGATVRDLLSMRSGIPDYADQLIEHYSRLPHGVDTRVGWAQLRALIPKQIGVANYDFEYSSTNFLLLTRVIEKVTGTTFAHALRHDLLDPARLDRVFVQDAERPTPPLARAAASIAGTGPYLPNTLVATGSGGAGCIAADAQSVARWGYALFDETVLRPATITAMLPTQFENYGLGVESVDEGDLTLVGHSGAAPGGRTGLWVDRADKISVAVLMATDNPDSDPVPVADALIQALRHS